MDERFLCDSMESGLRTLAVQHWCRVIFWKIEARDLAMRLIIVPHDRYPDTDFDGRVYSWRENGIAAFRLVDDGWLPGTLGRTRNLGHGPSGLEQDLPASGRGLPALTSFPPRGPVRTRLRVPGGRHGLPWSIGRGHPPSTTALRARSRRGPDSRSAPPPASATISV